MRITQVAPPRPVTDFEWLMVSTGYEGIAANTNKAALALNDEVGMFSDEQLEHILMLFSAIESHAMQVTNMVNQELDSR